MEIFFNVYADDISKHGIALPGASITASSALELPEEGDGEFEEECHRAKYELIPDFLAHINLDGCCRCT
jgi:hypothetical protein